MSFLTLVAAVAWISRDLLHCETPYASVWRKTLQLQTCLPRGVIISQHESSHFVVWTQHCVAVSSRMLLTMMLMRVMKPKMLRQHEPFWKTVSVCSLTSKWSVRTVLGRSY